MVTAFAIPGARLTAQSPIPHRQAHAHNDYLHPRPLLDALDQGFCSVEADIFLVDGELLVAHSALELKPDRTLRGLYLDPLRTRIRSNGGSVYGDGQRITLLIDIKSKGEATFKVLNAMLAEYPDVFTAVESGNVKQGPVLAIVSGDRPIKAITAEPIRFVGIDGRLSDLESAEPNHLIPLISDNWGVHFRWRGVGEMPVEEREKLSSIIEQAHAKNRLVRFWAIPDNPNMWRAMREAGVDLINTDDLEGLSRFLGMP